MNQIYGPPSRTITSEMMNGVQVTTVRITAPNGVVLREEWYENCVLSRIGSPAIIQRYPSGEIKSHTWCVGGKKHRVREPAYTEWYETGAIHIKEWVDHGVTHRDGDAPAYERWFKNGNPSGKIWIYEGKNHRGDNLPAFIKYNEKGEIECKIWFDRGEPHRTNGYAYISWKHAVVTECISYIRGKKIDHSHILMSNAKSKASFWIDNYSPPNPNVMIKDKPPCVASRSKKTRPPRK